MNQARPKDWWGRNWTWALPGILAVVALFACAVFWFVTFVFGQMKSSPAYVHALEMARASPKVIAAVGTPIEEGRFIVGEVTFGDESGGARLAIPIHGPKGSGSVRVVARESAGNWTYSTLFVHIDKTNERIELLESPE